MTSGAGVISESTLVITANVPELVNHGDYPAENINTRGPNL